MLIYEYEIPDPERPHKSQGIGPSGPLIPFRPPPLDTARVVGREITGWTPNAGTYGMGGPGFLGFQLEKEWLIVAVWGAAAWMRLEGRLLEDHFSEKYGRPPGWSSEPEEVRRRLFTGSHFIELNVGRISLTGKLDDGRLLKLAEDPGDRPLHEGSGKRREIGLEDDLRKVVFLAPTIEIWV